MNFKDLFFKETLEKGITARGGTGNRLRLLRFSDELGHHIYSLENISRGHKIYIERFLFDRFRAQIKILSTQLISDEDEVDIKIFFGDKSYFRIRTDKLKPGYFVIQSEFPREGSSGIFEFSKGAFKALLSILYHEKLKHTSDALDRIISYHKIFQFSFIDAGTSINSELATKKNILYSVEKFKPTIGRIGSLNPAQIKAGYSGRGNSGKKDEGQENFKAKLGEKVRNKAYQVDYDSLFGQKNEIEEIETKKQRKRSRSQDYFILPLLANEIKKFENLPFRCDLSSDERLDFDEVCPPKKKGSFYLGLEIVDVVHKKSGQLKTFKFPLYYMKVELVESGRTLYLKPVEQDRVYLNHIAIANLVDQFSHRRGVGNPIDVFFHKLYDQVFEHDGHFDRIRLFRHLPFSDDVFRKTRELIFGDPKSKGDHGLLDNLKIIGFEVDLESTFLYKIADSSSLIAQYLDKDLDLILEKAHDNPDKFYKTLLGQFLNPEIGRASEKGVFCEIPMLPGRIPHSMGSLLQSLNEHNILLLEGPPGTGKTFSILNLLIHCVCTNKRVLIVSDKIGAIHALTEKIQEYLMGKDRKSDKANRLDNLWKNSIKVVDEIPVGSDLANWAQSLKKMLKTDTTLSLVDEVKLENFEKVIKKIDEDIIDETDKIQQIMNMRLAGEKDNRARVATKNYHATTEKHINSFLNLLNTFKIKDQKIDDLDRFVGLRELLIKNNEIDIYESLSIPQIKEEWELNHKNLIYAKILINKILKQKPRDYLDFKNLLPSGELPFFIIKISESWSSIFRANDTEGKRKWKRFKSFFHHAGLKIAKKYLNIIENQLYFLENENYFELSKTLQSIHLSLSKDTQEDLSLDLEIYRYLREGSSHKNKKDTSTVQLHLNKIKELQEIRDLKIKECFINRLEYLESELIKIPKNTGTPVLTRAQSLLTDLEKVGELEKAWPILRDLQTCLSDFFPIWVCRKQTVPFLFPSDGDIFDLVIVDEATQCKVDDALPLLLRSKKVMAVGDDKQTVLAKNSVLDDYLFQEFDLSEHLRFSQGAAVKGGGSHLFGLIKNIKKSSIMLNEHYRCPPDVIEFSNRYVYNSKLSKMQWRPANSFPAVQVNYSEKNEPASFRKTSGTYKGIETDMIDRFFDWVITEVKRIEQEENKKINVETDIALCYFLLKNGPYFEDQKSKFLEKLKRGDQILHGAGAELQGKERDYIFYFWDIFRSNMAAFSQGDDELKRKGELNVLMSRPKVRAYHYLHGTFDKLNHGKTTITDYLWKTYLAQSQRDGRASFVVRKKDPGPGYYPWGRTSGELIKRLVQYHIQDAESFDFQTAVVVGDPRHRIDLIINRASMEKAIALVDLSGFHYHPEVSKDIVDYYFQLMRSTPALTPYFLFIYELTNEDNFLFDKLNSEKLKKSS